MRILTIVIKYMLCKIAECGSSYVLFDNFALVPKLVGRVWIEFAAIQANNLTNKFSATFKGKATYYWTS